MIVYASYFEMTKPVLKSRLVHTLTDPALASARG